jgi:hypothetical protein
MNSYAEFLAPDDKWLPLLNRGVVKLNYAANRVTWADSGQFAAPLHPVMGRGLAQDLAGLPLQPQAAMQALQGSADISRLLPAIQSLQLVSTIGALASVANLGVSCVGFALVLQRLSRIEGKLDQLMGEVAVLRENVEAIHAHQSALSLARFHSAGESLERSLAAEGAPARRELALSARGLFQESKSLYLELWKRTQPWTTPQIPVQTGLEMQGRFLAAALGEIQAEFVLGDGGTHRRAVEDCATSLREHMAIDQVSAFRSRSDAACVEGEAAVGRFHAYLPQLTAWISAAAGSAAWSETRVRALGEDMQTAQRIGLEPYEMARVVRLPLDKRMYLLGSPVELNALAA